MRRFLLSGLVFLFLTTASFSQVRDSIHVPGAELPIDTSFDYDELLDELDAFLDSLLRPKSYFVAGISVGNGFFNYARGNSQKIETRKSTALAPSLGYFHRWGPGITVTGNITDDGERLNLYQVAITPSFDFIQQIDWIGGLSFTHYINRDSLPFYLSPLQNEISAYFTWRGSWLQPGVTASYGWGSREAYQKREKFIKLLRLRRLIVNSGSREEISDFTLAASVRHSFYWMRVGGERNYLKFTPQFSFSAGTQKFGFNHTTSAYAVNNRRDLTQFYNSGDISMDEKLKFQPLSVTLYLRPEYNIGKFFVQPQLIFDYYLPAKDFAALFSINAGVVL